MKGSNVKHKIPDVAQKCDLSHEYGPRNLSILGSIKLGIMKEQIANGSIIDVQTPGEFSQGHLSDAINIPLEQLPQRLQEFRDMRKPIVAYCRSGNRSGMAVSILKQNGIAEDINGDGLESMRQQLK